MNGWAEAVVWNLSLYYGSACNIHVPYCRLIVSYIVSSKHTSSRCGFSLIFEIEAPSQRWTNWWYYQALMTSSNKKRERKERKTCTNDCQFLSIIIANSATSWGQHHIRDVKQYATSGRSKCLYWSTWKRPPGICTWLPVRRARAGWARGTVQPSLTGRRKQNKMCKCCVTCYFLGVVRCPSAKRSHPKETSWACTRWAHLLPPSPASGSSVDCERNLGQRLRQEQHSKIQCL